MRGDVAEQSGTGVLARSFLFKCFLENFCWDDANPGTTEDGPRLVGRVSFPLILAFSLREKEGESLPARNARTAFIHPAVALFRNALGDIAFALHKRTSHAFSLLSRPLGTLSFIRNGGEGRGEEALGLITSAKGRCSFFVSKLRKQNSLITSDTSLPARSFLFSSTRLKLTGKTPAPLILPCHP
jgi:hypothetical protein